MSTSTRSQVRLSSSARMSASGCAMQVKAAVNEVDADDAQGLLLVDRLAVEHAHMDDDLGRIGARLGLKANAQPAVALRRGACATVLANTKKAALAPRLCSSRSSSNRYS